MKTNMEISVHRATVCRTSRGTITVRIHGDGDTPDRLMEITQEECGNLMRALEMIEMLGAIA